MRDDKFALLGQPRNWRKFLPRKNFMFYSVDKECFTKMTCKVNNSTCLKVNLEMKHFLWRQTCSWWGGGGGVHVTKLQHSDADF